MLINPSVAPTARANRVFVARARPGRAGPRVRVTEWRPAMAIEAKAPAQMWAGVALKP